jgi:protoporphyrinogen oxidase
VIRSPRIVVVGAGISGLATAFALQEAWPAAVISVLENQGRVGGTIWTEHRDGFQVEYGPTAFLGNQASTLCLAHKVGLKDEIIEPSPAAQLRFLWHDGQMHALPTSLGGLFGSKLISFAGLYRRGQHHKSPMNQFTSSPNAVWVAPWRTYSAMR